MKTVVAVFISLCFCSFGACGRARPSAQTPTASEPAGGKTEPAGGKTEPADGKTEPEDGKAEPPVLDPRTPGETDPPEEPTAKQDSSVQQTPVPAAPGSYPGSRRLCDQRVYGQTGEGLMEIHWTLDASTHSINRVAEHYRQLGGTPDGVGKGEFAFEFASGHKVLVYSSSDRSRHPSCGVHPKAGEGTLVRISRALTRK